MLVINVHQFGHRLLENGIMESAEFDGEKYGVWGQRSQTEMNMTGADETFIRSTLKRMSQIFPAGYRLPKNVTQEQKKFTANDPR